MTRNYNILITNGIQLTYQIDDILNTVIIIIDSTVVFVDILMQFIVVGAYALFNRGITSYCENRQLVLWAAPEQKSASLHYTHSPLHHMMSDNPLRVLLGRYIISSSRLSFTGSSCRQKKGYVWVHIPDVYRKVV